MKQVFYLLTSVIGIVLLSGCGNQFTTENLDKIVSEIPKNEELNKYLVSIDYQLDERSEPGEEDEYYYYDLTGELSEGFTKLPLKEQYEFFASIVKLTQKNGGTPQGDSEFFCGEGITCDIGHIDLNTSKHKYGVEYYPDSTSDLFFVDDEIVYDASAKDGKYVDPLSKEEESAVEDTDTSTSSDSVDSQETTDVDSDSSDSSYSSTDNSESEMTTYTGADWVNLSFDEKFITVQTIIEAMESGGRTVTADAYWFIDALNAYYEDGQGPTATEKVLDIMVMSGVAGEVIK